MLTPRLQHYPKKAVRCSAASSGAKMSPGKVFICPEESTFYSKCLKNLLLSQKRHVTCLEFGSGDGGPVIESIRSAAKEGSQANFAIQGFEVSQASAEIAEANIKKHGCSEFYRVSASCFFEGVAAFSRDPAGLPDQSWLIANPPYLPAEDDDILMPSIWGGYDGASLTNRLLSSEFDNALLLLSSFSNPCNTIAHAQQLGYRVSDYSLCLLPFGTYSSEAKVKRHIRRLKEQGKAFFIDSAPDARSAANETNDGGCGGNVLQQTPLDGYVEPRTGPWYMLAGVKFAKRKGGDHDGDDHSEALQRALTSLVA